MKSTKQSYETYARESHMQIEVISTSLAKKDYSQGNLLNANTDSDCLGTSCGSKSCFTMIYIRSWHVINHKEIEGRTQQRLSFN